MKDLSVRISFRSDTLTNWTNLNPILLKGEIAIVFDDDNQLFKVGNGISCFNDLPFSFYDQFASKQMNTDVLKAKSISQGFKSSISGIGGIATGYKSQVSANFAQAHGHQSNVSSDFGYVWNGDTSTSTYIDHGPGTYNINSTNGLSGVYFGQDSVADILNMYCKTTETSSAVEISRAFENVKISPLSGLVYDLTEEGAFTKLVVDIGSALGASVLIEPIQ